MKENINKLKVELNTKFNEKLTYWNNLKSKKAKVAIIALCMGIICLKIFTTIFTVDWLTDMFGS